MNKFSKLLCLCGILHAPTDLFAQKTSKISDEVTSCYNIHYVSGGNEKQTLDIYLPKNETGQSLPLIIWVHGGGWGGGDKNNCPPLENGFVRHGYAIASINYRLTPDNRFPAQLEDCKAAVRWLRANAADYNLDPDRFAAWGSSAGGHLASLLGVTGNTRQFDAGENLNFSSCVQAVIDVCGPSDLTAREMWDPFFNTRAQLLGGTLEEKPELAAAASPQLYVTKDSAPFSIWHGTKDPRVPISQSERLHETLWKAGVQSELNRVENAGHSLHQHLAEKELTDKIVLFLKKHL
ncbi:MAG: alpha/beta hydrolase [Kiritimatiellales bacterium]